MHEDRPLNMNRDRWTSSATEYSTHLSGRERVREREGWREMEESTVYIEAVSLEEEKREELEKIKGQRAKYRELRNKEMRRQMK